MGTVTADGLVGHAIWVPNARNGGGTYDPDGWGYPWRVVAHTIEGSASPGMIAGHPYPPHLWYDPATRVLYQTVPLGRSAFALYQAGDAPHYTNKARALQVEIAGHAADTAVWPTEWCDNIAEDVIVPFCEWAAMQGGQIDLLGFIPDPGPIPGSATADAPQRLTPDQWAALRSMCGHRHVPMGDDHWDPGGLDLRRIARHAAIIIGAQLDQLGDTMPDYLLHAVDSGNVVARYPSGAVKHLAYHELVHLQQAGVKQIDTDAANLAVVLADGTA